MKAKIVLLLFAVLILGKLQAQQRPTKPPAMPDINALMKMTPEEREKYAEQMKKQLTEQAADMSKEMNIAFDPSSMPGYNFTPPVKDLKKLAVIPVTPPSRQQLLSQVSKMEISLKKIAPSTVVQQVEQFSASKSIKEIQQASVGTWYGGEPQAALLLNMKAVQKQPNDGLAWNNLASQLSLTKMEEQAIPILQNLLEENPNSSVVLNNLGQAFLSLGELNRANQYLQRCLEIDDLHPEANRSMGMLKLYAKDLAAAARHFEKEMLVAHRRSSLAQLRKAVEGKKLNLNALRKKKMQLDGVDKKNFFEEIKLGEFELPDLPKKSDETVNWTRQHADYFQSIQQEMLFWAQAGKLSEKELVAEGKKHHGIYFDLVDILLSELGDEYSDLLGLITEDESSHLMNLTTAYYKTINEIKCPEPPVGHSVSGPTFEAYQRKCCDMKKPITDKYVNEYNGFISARYQVVNARWKEYINAMISIVQLDPSAGNKLMVYRAVSAYFTFLMSSAQAVMLTAPPMECEMTSLTAEEADELLKTSNRAYEIKCPSWLKANFSVSVAKIKADCESFSVEADVYKLISVGMQKKFSTGTSTLYVGASLSGKLAQNVLSGSVSQQFYIVFDNNNEFADLGMRGSGGFNIANGMFGETISYDFSMNNGFNGNWVAASDWVKKLESAMGFIAK